MEIPSLVFRAATVDPRLCRVSRWDVDTTVGSSPPPLPCSGFCRFFLLVGICGALGRRLTVDSIHTWHDCGSLRPRLLEKPSD